MDNKEIVEILKGLAVPTAGYRTIWALNIAMAFFSEADELPDDLDPYNRGFEAGWNAALDCVEAAGYSEKERRP